MNTLLSYFGGKFYLASRLASLILPGYFDLYCEPFCGSAAMADSGKELGDSIHAR
jgi:site-specific DNA-adenine methylase